MIEKDRSPREARKEESLPPAVGIGASADGLTALQTFFEHVPEKSRLAFVVVGPLPSHRESRLGALLQPHVNMPVEQIAETTPLERDHVYVIPPNANLNTIDTHLHLSALEEERRARTQRDFSRYKRSTLEGLRSSKGDLQSMNEELQTVSPGNQHKMKELSPLSSALQNLLAATDIATLFLDRELCISRFTPKVSELFNMRQTDRGRPIAGFTHKLGYDDLPDDAERVLRQLTSLEREVQNEQGRWYLTRLLPYRSPEDRTEGVVITFIDITERKKEEEILRRSEAFHRCAVEAGDVGTWSVVPEDRPSIQAAIATAVRQNEAFDSTFRIQLRHGGVRWLHARGSVSEGGPGHPDRMYGASVDITKRREAEEQLRRSEGCYRLLVESAGEYTIIMIDPGGRIVTWNPGAESTFGYVEDDITGQPGDVLYPPEDRTSGSFKKTLETARDEEQAFHAHWVMRKDGSCFWSTGVITGLDDEDGNLSGFALVMRDTPSAGATRKNWSSALRSARGRCASCPHGSRWPNRRSGTASRRSSTTTCSRFSVGSRWS